MHPNKAFRFDSDAAMLDWAVERGFAHVLAATVDGPMVAHAPIAPAGDKPDNGAVRFHIARANRIAPLLDGARVVLSIAGPDGYITPNWYVDPSKQVPTWNYVAVEIEGTARVLDEDGLIEQLDTLAAIHEPRVIPENPWTRAKMDDGRFRAMLRAIIGFEVTIEAVRGTNKLSQNKSETDRNGAIDGLADTGNIALADLMRNA
ncbi:FMN-binding negative transcriptional regulator [Sphingomonas sp. QA11]|uniref:FMN-binding negative transcriptional regulator n=1 Tax=Sphingomonas sp. QA11 TaxID=2950605 RepID=UPI00234BB666|nr:FMN-binding negative transcriptional regulator [Sphingomonas sp. QA11]WCM27601.1 FMN-binding negative transcriptional regulator [Sphingomonas sp. QA11]